MAAMNISVLERRGEWYLTFGGILFFFGAVAAAMSIGMIAFAMDSTRLSSISEADLPVFFNVLMAASSASLVFLFFAALLLWRGKRLNTLGTCSSSLPEGLFRVDGAFRTPDGVLVVMVAGRPLGSSADSVANVELCVKLKQGRYVELVGTPTEAVGPGKFYLQVSKHSIHHSDVRDRTVITSENRDWVRYTFLPVPSKEAEGNTSA